MAIVAAAIILPGITASIGGFTSISEQERAEFIVMDSGRGVDVSQDYVADVYTNKTSEVDGLADLQWLSTQGADEVSLGFETYHRYYIKLSTSLPEYKNSSVIWGIVEKGRLYLVNVFVDPESTFVNFRTKDDLPLAVLPDGKNDSDFLMDIIAINATCAWNAIFDVDFCGSRGSA